MNYELMWFILKDLLLDGLSTDNSNQEILNKMAAIEVEKAVDKDD
jgi:hypothetical protein